MSGNRLDNRSVVPDIDCQDSLPLICAVTAVHSYSRIPHATERVAICVMDGRTLETTNRYSQHTKATDQSASGVEQTAFAGEQAASGVEQMDSAGDQASAAGKQAASAGKQAASAGKQAASAGKQAASAGIHAASADELQESSAGEQMPSSDDNLEFHTSDLACCANDLVSSAESTNDGHLLTTTQLPIAVQSTADRPSISSQLVFMSTDPKSTTLNPAILEPWTPDSMVLNWTNLGPESRGPRAPEFKITEPTHLEKLDSDQSATELDNGKLTAVILPLTDEPCATVNNQITAGTQMAVNLTETVGCRGNVNFHHTAFGNGEHDPVDEAVNQDFEIASTNSSALYLDTNGSNKPKRGATQNSDITEGVELPEPHLVNESVINPQLDPNNNQTNTPMRPDENSVTAASINPPLISTGNSDCRLDSLPSYTDLADSAADRYIRLRKNCIDRRSDTSDVSSMPEHWENPDLVPPGMLGEPGNRPMQYSPTLEDMKGQLSVCTTTSEGNSPTKLLPSDEKVEHWLTSQSHLAGLKEEDVNPSDIKAKCSSQSEPRRMRTLNHNELLEWYDFLSDHHCTQVTKGELRECCRKHLNTQLDDPAVRLLILTRIRRTNSIQSHVGTSGHMCEHCDRFPYDNVCKVKPFIPEHTYRLTRDGLINFYEQTLNELIACPISRQEIEETIRRITDGEGRKNRKRVVSDSAVYNPAQCRVIEVRTILAPKLAPKRRALKRRADTESSDSNIESAPSKRCHV